MEDDTEIYVTNGEFIKAAMLLDYKIKIYDYPNCHFNLGIKTAANKRFWKKNSKREK